MPRNLGQFVFTIIIAAICSVCWTVLPLGREAAGQTSSSDSNPATKLPSQTKYQMGLSAKQASEAAKAKPRPAATWGKPGTKAASRQKQPVSNSKKNPTSATFAKPPGSTANTVAKPVVKNSVLKTPVAKTPVKPIAIPPVNATTLNPKRLPAPVPGQAPHKTSKTIVRKKQKPAANSPIAEMYDAQTMDQLMLVAGLLTAFVLLGFVASIKRRKQKEAASAEAAAIIHGAGTRTSSLAVSLMQPGAGKAALTGSMPQTGFPSHIGKAR